MPGPRTRPNVVELADPEHLAADDQHEDASGEEAESVEGAEEPAVEDGRATQ